MRLQHVIKIIILTLPLLMSDMPAVKHLQKTYVHHICPWQNLYSASNPSLAQLLEADENLFYNIRYNPNHSLHYLLPKQTERSYSLRSRSHNFELSCMHDDRNFIDQMFFKAYHTVLCVNVSSLNVCCFHCILSISSL